MRPARRGRLAAGAVGVVLTAGLGVAVPIAEASPVARSATAAGTTAATVSGAARGATAAASGAASLEGTLAGLSPGQRTRVVVTLKDRADLSTRPRARRRERLRTVVTRLKDTAVGSQVRLRGRLRTLRRRGEVTSVTPLWVTNAVSVTGTARAVREIARRREVASVVPDPVVVEPAAASAVTAEANIAATGAPELWASGQTGQGVVVATLDTGVDVSNPDLAASWRGGANSWYDPYNEHADAPVDVDGHGTATTGVVVGDQDGGTSYGMAPGARWIAARVFDDRGMTSATAIHQAFQWVIDPDRDPSTPDAPQVVNGSWALGTGPSCDLSFQPDVRALTAAGIVPVFAAGNFGPGSSTSASPANYPESFSVGAVDGADTGWAYASRGPSDCGGRTRVFPDVVAPGVRVLAADRLGSFTELSGTSIAAPHVAGALALLRGARPGMTGATVESALTSTARDLGAAGPDDRYGFGRVDVAAANAWAATAPDYSLAISPTATSTDAGEDASFDITVVPVNGFDGETTLALDGLPAGAGTTSFSPATVGPAGWTSTLTVSTAAELAGGSYPVTVTATGGGLTRSATAVLTVTAAPAPDFTVAASPSVVKVRRGKVAKYTVTLGSVDGFTEPVTLAASGLPKRTRSRFTTNPAPAPGLVTWKVRTRSRTPRGTYPLHLTATGGGVAHDVTVTLVVR